MPARAPARSTLRAGAVDRLLIAAVPSAALWLAVAWALGWL
jgi:hypothetical protein